MVCIVLSNPNAIPGKCSQLEANYGNGWSAADAASEIVKLLRGILDESAVWDTVRRNLHVTTIHRKRGARKHPDGGTIGNHAKFIAVDDRAYYVGSQNLYIANL